MYFNRIDDNMTIDFHFQSANIVKYRTDVTFGWLDLMVSFGGIAGLFLGCSILSGAEILYYLIIISMKIMRRLKKRVEKFLERHSNLIKANVGNQVNKKFQQKADNVRIIKIQTLSDIDNIKVKLRNENKTRY